MADLRNGASVADLAAPLAPLVAGGGPGTLAAGPDVATLLYSDPKLGGDGGYCFNEDKGLVKWRWTPMTLNGTNQFAQHIGPEDVLLFFEQVLSEFDIIDLGDQVAALFEAGAAIA